MATGGLNGKLLEWLKEFHQLQTTGNRGNLLIIYYDLQGLFQSWREECLHD